MIPEFGLGDVLPPFVGHDIIGAEGLPRSPYPATMSQVVERFCTSPERAQILRGLKNFRDALRHVGVTDGFQWIDGSFVERCEASKGRPPADIDVLTMVKRPRNQTDDVTWSNFIEANADLFDSVACKANFACDAYFVDLGAPQELVAQSTAYWFGLFSHQRDTFRWKGLVQVGLQCDDEAAMLLLAGIEAAW